MLFVALYFSAILPEALLLGSLALVAQYFVGKFSLLRLCGPTPDVGFQLARLSRNYFIPLVLVIHVVMSAYWWSGYPYDNVCQQERGDFTYCDQNFWSARIFPPLPRFQESSGVSWMTSSQAVLTSFYGWASFAVLILSAFAFLQGNAIPFVRGLYESSYKVSLFGKKSNGSSSVIMLTYCLFPTAVAARRDGSRHPFQLCQKS